MAFDDPIMWVLIIAAVVFLFGSSKIPQLARGLGQARHEFDRASKGITNPPSTSSEKDTAIKRAGAPEVEEDPLIAAARKEGISTDAKTKEQIANELAWKLKKK